MGIHVPTSGRCEQQPCLRSWGPGQLDTGRGRDRRRDSGDSVTCEGQPKAHKGGQRLVGDRPWIQTPPDSAAAGLGP